MRLLASRRRSVNGRSGAWAGIAIEGSERPLWVEPCRSISIARTAGVGAPRIAMESHAKVWIRCVNRGRSTREPTAPAIPPLAARHPQCEDCDLGYDPVGGARPSHDQAAFIFGLQLDLLGYDKRVVYLNAEIGEPCFPASCAREATVPLSSSPFSHISVP